MACWPSGAIARRPEVRGFPGGASPQDVPKAECQDTNLEAQSAKNTDARHEKSSAQRKKEGCAFQRAYAMLKKEIRQCSAG